MLLTYLYPLHHGQWQDRPLTLLVPAVEGHFHRPSNHLACSQLQTLLHWDAQSSLHLVSWLAAHLPSLDWQHLLQPSLQLLPAWLSLLPLKLLEQEPILDPSLDPHQIQIQTHHQLLQQQQLQRNHFHLPHHR
ncbi:hypothetical protein V8G54_015034 [Vigna mungo]|uniref:Uncharacterized protein n=1 Tax=Vigna mungo TaxID=3915 RepID=A0AAQ3S014_VIGMU